MNKEESTKYSWLIGMGSGINMIKGDKGDIPDTGKCKIHGHYSLTLDTATKLNQMQVMYECPYCKQIEKENKE